MRLAAKSIAALVTILAISIVALPQGMDAGVFDWFKKRRNQSIVDQMKDKREQMRREQVLPCNSTFGYHGTDWRPWQTSNGYCANNDACSNDSSWQHSTESYHSAPNYHSEPPWEDLPQYSPELQTDDFHSPQQPPVESSDEKFPPHEQFPPHIERLPQSIVNDVDDSTLPQNPVAAPNQNPIAGPSVSTPRELPTESQPRPPQEPVNAAPEIPAIPNEPVVPSIPNSVAPKSTPPTKPAPTLPALPEGLLEGKPTSYSNNVPVRPISVPHVRPPLPPLPHEWIPPRQHRQAPQGLPEVIGPGTTTQQLRGAPKYVPRGPRIRSVIPRFRNQQSSINQYTPVPQQYAVPPQRSRAVPARSTITLASQSRTIPTRVRRTEGNGTQSAAPIPEYEPTTVSPRAQFTTMPRPTQTLNSSPRRMVPPRHSR